MKHEVMTPTWEAVYLIFVEAYRNTGDAKHLEEIKRMAKLADKYVASATPPAKGKALVAATEEVERPLMLYVDAVLNNKKAEPMVRLLALVFKDLRVNGLARGGYDMKQLRDYDND